MNNNESIGEYRKLKLVVMSGVKRGSYEAKFKLQVKVFAEDIGNRAAGRELLVSEKK